MKHLSIKTLNSKLILFFTKEGYKMLTNYSLSAKKKYLNLYASLGQTIRTLSDIISCLEDDTSRSYISCQLNTQIESIIYHLNNLTQDKILICNHILQCINSLDNETEKNILLLKYISCYTWEQISELLNYSLRQIYYLHNHALEHLNLNIDTS